MDSESAPQKASLKFLLIGALPVLAISLITALLADYMKMGHIAAWIVGISIFGVGIYSLANLSRAPRELWITFGLKFFVAVAYKLAAVIFVSYMLKDAGMTDSQAQWLWGAWGIAMSVCTICSGAITDAIGIRRTLLIGLSLCIISRLALALSNGGSLSLIFGISFLAIGEALCTPVLVSATRKFTTATERSVAFSIIYALLNMGFMFGNFIRDGVLNTLSEGSGSYEVGGFSFSPQKTMFLVGLVFEIVALALTAFMRGEKIVHAKASLSWIVSVKQVFAELSAMLMKMIKNDIFRRLLLFLLLIGLLKIVFSLMDAVNPIFAEREMGRETHDNIGKLNAVNSILIMILAPLAGIFTRKYSAYSVVVVGGIFTALSFLFMVLPPSWFAGLANGSLGTYVGKEYMSISGAIHPYLIMMFFWTVLLSIGEAIYSPRVSEYAVSIAPDGQEASYASLSAVPMLLSKLISSAVTATLIPLFFPATGVRNVTAMWLSLGGLVILSPLLLLIFRNYIRAREAGES